VRSRNNDQDYLADILQYDPEYTESDMHNCAAAYCLSLAIDLFNAEIGTGSPLIKRFKALEARVQIANRKSRANIRRKALVISRLPPGQETNVPSIPANVLSASTARPAILAPSPKTAECAIAHQNQQCPGVISDKHNMTELVNC
jgi:hypothetical protein